jgi:hypothetical protein
MLFVTYCSDVDRLHIFMLMCCCSAGTMLLYLRTVQLQWLYVTSQCWLVSDVGSCLCLAQVPASWQKSWAGKICLEGRVYTIEWELPHRRVHNGF